MKVSNLYSIRCRFYGSPSEQNCMCELRMHVFTNPVTYYIVHFVLYLTINTTITILLLLLISVLISTNNLKHCPEYTKCAMSSLTPSNKPVN